jgi:hypothetical protein
MKHKLSSVLKILIAVLSLAYIAYKITEQVREGVPMDFAEMSVVPLLAAVALIPLNWLVEAAKWRILTSHLQPLTVGQSLRAVLSGLAVSLLTPNRVGDFAGRIALLKPENRSEGAMSAFVGGYGQMLVIAILGVVAFGMKPALPDFLLWTVSRHALVLAVLVVAIVALACIYFFGGKAALRFRFSHWPWLEKFVRAAGRHSFVQLLSAFVLTTLRCAVFMLQFGLVLEAAGLHLAFGVAFCSIALMYAFVSVIPTFALVEWGVRGSMALLFIMPVGGQPAQIVTATAVVWLMNVALPAAVGAFLTAFSAKSING